MLITNAGAPGDSGAAVYLNNNGHPVVVGLVIGGKKIKQYTFTVCVFLNNEVKRTFLNWRSELTKPTSYRTDF